MKVALVHASPDPGDGASRALDEIARELQSGGIDTIRFALGAKPVRGCMECGRCTRLQGCILDERVERFLPLVDAVDGFAFAAPARFGRQHTLLFEFLDQLWYWEARRNETSRLAFKPAAVVASVRGARSRCSFKTARAYLDARDMPVVAADAKGIVHGATSTEAERDLEGLEAMRAAARSLAAQLRQLERESTAGRAPAPRRYNPNDRIV